MKKLLILFLIAVSALFTISAAPIDNLKIEDFNGKPIGVQTAVLYEELVRNRLPDTEFMYYTMPNDMILSLVSGKISAYLVEEVGYGVQKKNHPELEILSEYAGYIDATCIIGNNEKKDILLSQLNEFIAECKSDGTLSSMYDYWINNFDPETSTCDIGGFTGENGEINVAVEGGYEPFSFVSNGRISGFDVDFACRFCRKYGYTPKFNEVPFEAIAPGVETGKFDIGMNIVVSEERNETGTLSDIYYSCPICFVVLGDDTSSLTFIQKMENSFYKTFIKESRWKLFVKGSLTTILITFASIAIGTVIGFIVFILCKKGGWIPNNVTRFFLWLVHGMPTVLLLMILYYIVFGKSRMPGTAVSIVGFSLIFACSMIDMLRVGTNAVGRGQEEAARSLGYTDQQGFFKIILPQAARHFLPIYKNEVVTLIKETSVVGYIAVLDLTKISDLVRSRTYEAFFPLILTAAIYFIIAAVMTNIVKNINNRIDPHRRPEAKILKDITPWE